jgi:hypothetical protein
MPSKVPSPVQRANDLESSSHNQLAVRVCPAFSDSPASGSVPLFLAFADIFAFIVLPSKGFEFRFAGNAERCIEQMPSIFPFELLQI